MSRSFTAAKPLTFVTLSVLATWITFGCAREPGELDPLPTPWNADDIAKGRCVQTCTPDFGPRPITMEDCARVEEGLEFLPEDVWNWEPTDPPDPNARAQSAYAYQDGTTEFLATHSPIGDESNPCTVEDHADPNKDGEEDNCQSDYNPRPATVDRCGSTRALHVRGGPFREWGGGIGVRLDGLASAAARKMGGIMCTIPPPENPDAATPSVCPDFDPHFESAPGILLSPETDTQPERRYGKSDVATPYYLMRIDLREYDGIAFWARRGPDSQPGFRIVLGDKNTDDDVSMLETAIGIEKPRCRRAKECDCRNHRPCTPGPSGGFFCWDPALDESPEAQWHPWNHEPYRCGITACNDPYAAYEDVPDWPFITPEYDSSLYAPHATASCNTYTFENDITRQGCFDKNGLPPPESSERCGDPWIAPVRLSPDWEFYRVPFSELRQEGYGKEFPAFDRSAVTMVRFTWSQGWVDYWIDDVRFYRKKR